MTPSTLATMKKWAIHLSWHWFEGILCLGAMAISACQSTPEPAELSPSEVVLRQSQERIERSRRRAFETTEDQAPYTVPARLNPARCPSPDFEVRIHGMWSRVYLVPERASVRQALESFRRRSLETQRFKRARLEVVPDGERRAQSGMRFPVMAVRNVIMSSREQPRRSGREPHPSTPHPRR